MKPDWPVLACFHYCKYWDRRCLIRKKKVFNVEAPNSRTGSCALWSIRLSWNCTKNTAGFLSERRFTRRWGEWFLLKLILFAHHYLFCDACTSRLAMNLLHLVLWEQRKGHTRRWRAQKPQIDQEPWVLSGWEDKKSKPSGQHLTKVLFWMGIKSFMSQITTHWMMKSSTWLIDHPWWHTTLTIDICDITRWTHTPNSSHSMTLLCRERKVHQKTRNVAPSDRWIGCAHSPRMAGSV